MPKKQSYRFNDDGPYVYNPDIPISNLGETIRRFIAEMDNFRKQEFISKSPLRPSIFQPDPLVVGDPWEAKVAQKLIDVDPAIKANVSRLYFGGPSPSRIGSLFESNLNPEDFDYTNTKGQYSMRDKTIDIVPRLHQSSFIKTLLHELSHATGTRDTGANNAYDIIDRIFGKEK